MTPEHDNDALPAAFHPRELRIHRPDSALPWAGADPEWTRVAEHRDEEVGAYELKPLGPTRFRVVRLRVREDFRRRGVGTWLLRHAIGTAESSGARIVEAPAAGSFFQRNGFRSCADVLQLTLTPE